MKITCSFDVCGRFSSLPAGKSVRRMELPSNGIIIDDGAGIKK